MYRSKKEKRFAKLIQTLGKQFQINDKSLPSTPDIVFPNEKLVVFFHGCFWHSHGCKERFFRREKLSYWKNTLRKQKISDLKSYSELHALGYSVIVEWECKFDKNPNGILEEIKERLNLKMEAEPLQHKCVNHI